MDKGKFYETLVRLYLRLNGYFQTGLISHSDEWGNNATEIDTIAIRFPKHDQPEREVGFCPTLVPSSTTIDIVLAEVKTSNVEFNKPLKSAHRLADRNWEQILNWIGLFEPKEIQRLLPHLKSSADSNTSNLEGLEAHSVCGQVKIRPIIFSIESLINNQNPKTYISGDEIIDYLWLCLCPPSRRADCSTKYPLSNWGTEFQNIVDYFKKQNDLNYGKPSLADLALKFSLV